MDMRETATGIVRELQAAGFAAYFVGGCVRDQLLGREPQDLDVATSARPDQIEALFPHCIPVGKKFGVIIVIRDSHQFQVATFRADSEYVDGRRPVSVEFCDAKEDALRRDFTVNGLFYDPIARSLHDWVGGKADLEARIIRTIGAPDERFAEDHLRLLRTIRFAAQLDFQIEGQTLESVQRNAARITIISAERIRDELLKLFMPPHAARGLQLLRESNLLEFVFPELFATITCDQSPNFHPEGTVFNHILLMLQQLPADASTSLVWSALLHDIAKPVTASKDPSSESIHFYGHEKIGAEMTGTILERLRFPARQIDEISECVLHHMQFKDVAKMRKATLRRMILRPTFPVELELHRLDCLGSHRRLDHYDFMIAERAALSEKPHLVPALISGNDLLEMGLKPGPEIGALLKDIRDRQLAEELLDREAALHYARSVIDTRE